MSKKTHRKQLERARARRQAESRLHRRQRMTRAIVVALVVAMVATIGGVLVASQGDTGTPQVDDDQASGSESPDPGATETPTGDAEPVAGAPPRDSLEPCDTTRPDVADTEKPSWDEPPAMQIDPSATYTATIATTCGDIEIELFASDAPKTVNNFVFLAENDFYDGVPFHRTIWGFMIQGGDPTGTGTGGPGYSFEDELGTVATYGYERGNLAMANSGPDTNGSQFFIVQGDASHLSTHTVFGRVTAGMEVVDRIAAMPAGPNGTLQPDQMVWITDVRIDQGAATG